MFTGFKHSEKSKAQITKSLIGKQANEKHWKWSNNPSYLAIHKWLYRNFGKATKCESKKCNKKSTLFDWALKKGYKYERNRMNFKQLCKSCHNYYDKHKG